MNEIKFRQPIFYEGKFIKFHYWGAVRKGEFTSPRGPVDNIEKSSQAYTGHKDISGKDLYVGDIVCAVNFYNMDMYKGIVKWSQIEGRFYYDFEEKCYVPGLSSDSITEVVILGNIYQPPKEDYNGQEISSINRD